MLQPITLKENNSEKNAFLIKKEDSFLFVCSELCGNWLKEIGKENLVHTTQCDVLEDKFYEVIPKKSLNQFDDSWIYDFELTEDDEPKFYHISKFFEHFLNLTNCSLTEKLEASLTQVEPFLSTGDILPRLVRFVMDKQWDENERVRLLVSNQIQQYVSQ